MPISFASTRINNKSAEYVTVRASVEGGDSLVIFKDSLERFDIKALDVIEDNETGVDLFEKMTEYDMPNGQKAVDYFEPFYRKLNQSISEGAADTVQTARGLVTDTLTVGVRADRPHVFVSFKYFDSDQYDNQVTPSGGTVDVLGQPSGGSGYFEVFGSPLAANDPSDYAEQGSSLTSVRCVPNVATAGATHYIMSVTALKGE